MGCRTLASSTPFTSENLVLPSIWGRMSGEFMTPRDKPPPSMNAPRALNIRKMPARYRMDVQIWDLRVGSACTVQSGFFRVPRAGPACDEARLAATPVKKVAFQNRPKWVESKAVSCVEPVINLIEVI